MATKTKLFGKVKVDAKGNAPKKTALYVPNTEEGQAFLKQLRSFFNFNHQKLTVRGRGSRKAAAEATGNWSRYYQAHLPHEFASYFSVYIEPKDRHLLTEYHQRGTEISSLRKALEAAEAKNQELQLRTTELATALVDTQQKFSQYKQLQAEQPKPEPKPEPKLKKVFRITIEEE